LAVPSETLTVDDVRRIHFALVEEFATSSNPLFPPGVKSETLLESAVFRQHTSLAGVLKYPDPYSNAATLCFGICCDHPFHNGNKRTALVALLVHLYRNRLALEGIGESDLYDLVLKIATHDLSKDRKSSKSLVRRPLPDDEVRATAAWIKTNSRTIERGHRQVTYRQLRHILEHFHFILSDPYKNTIDISRLQKTTDLFFRTREIPIRIGSIPYPGDKVIVSVKDMKYVRHLCKLTAEDGVDSPAFYDEGEPIDAFIVEHRSILYKLANK
jgi:death-on-curing protein